MFNFFLGLYFGGLLTLLVYDYETVGFFVFISWRETLVSLVLILFYPITILASIIINIYSHRQYRKKVERIQAAREQNMEDRKTIFNEEKGD
ncbi:MAG: hypothetical protein Q7S12_00255 [bacterium]|nr:hypothetical protein [bacterium]